MPASGVYAAATDASTGTTRLIVTTNPSATVDTSWIGSEPSWVGPVGFGSWNSSPLGTSVKESADSIPTGVDLPRFSVPFVVGGAATV